MKTMQKILSLILALTMLLSIAAFTASAAETDADYVFRNGLVITEDENQPQVSSFAVKDNRFVYVGEESGELNALIGGNTKVIDLDGKMVTPNLIDAHTHVTVGMTDWHIRMPSEIWELEPILDYVKNYCQEHSFEEAPFCYFEYYPSDLFGAEGPHKEVLDEIASDRPVLVQDFSDHACWVNTKFLEMIGAYDLVPGDAGYDNFMRNSDGELSGWIKEGSWQEYAGAMYEQLGWYPPEDCTEELMHILTDDHKRWGVTGVMDALMEQELQVESISSMDKKGELNMYFRQAVMLEDFSTLEEQLAAIHRLNDAFGTDRVRVDTLKIFYDGTNELGNSALVDGTVMNPDDHGYLMMDYEETLHLLRRCNEEKVDPHFHLVGDLAFRQVCDATEALIAELGQLDIQVEMCHCELVHPDDMGRPAQLGIIINWTPHWSGGYFGSAALEYLGQERYDSMYQFNPMIESGAIVTFGSDIYSMYEEHRANPYFGMQTAMTRIDIEYPLEEGMRASENAKLSLENLLKGYTIQAAKQLRIDDKTGSIEVGKYANFNIYAENLFEVPAESFQHVMPESVVFEGAVISGEEIH